MLAVSGRPPDEAGWAIEFKWDGIRTIAVCDERGCRLYSRTTREITGSFPDIAAELAEQSGRELILDGEIIAPDARGAPSFALLQRRMNVDHPSHRLIAAVPVQLFLFDVLADGGQEVTGQPYLWRRERLQELGLTIGLVQTPPHWVNIGAEYLLAAARDNDVEGIVSKRTDSTYLPGQRTRYWIRTPLRRTTEAIVAGWTTGAGATRSTFGSLILAGHDRPGHLVHIGNVGTGFTAAGRRALRGRLDELARTDSPLSEASAQAGTEHWVEPTLVGDIEYREYTGAGLRHPSWRGLRNDKVPEEIGMPG